MKNRSYSALKVLVLCFLVVSVLLPLLSLFTHMTFEDMQKVVANDGFSTMLINSVSLTLASTLISVLLAFVLAWMINRSHIRYKAMFSLLFTLPMLIPSISHGMGAGPAVWGQWTIHELDRDQPTYLWRSRDHSWLCALFFPGCFFDAD